MITDLEPDTLECKVKWALASITTNKASGGDGIPMELFQILKDDAVKVTNRFKELDLIDRVPEELWTEIHNRVQEARIKKIPKKKKYKKAKWLSEEPLPISEKRREVKGKGERKDITV